MALRFLARNGSRRLARRAAEMRHAEISPSLSSSISRSKHTIWRQAFAQGHAFVREFSAQNAHVLVTRAFAEANSGIISKAPGLAEFSQAFGNSQRINSAHHVASQGLRGLALTRCAVREGFHHANPPAFYGSSRGFGSFNAGTLSKPSLRHSKGNAAGVLHPKTLFRRISTDAITKKLKLSPSTMKQPIDELRKSASRYKDVAGLQVEAFWKRNVMILVGAAGVLACFLLWQVMYGVANLFVSFSEGMAKFGFLAMAAATVAFAAMALRARYTINPDKVYRIVMRMLNTSAPALEVLGPPLTGTDLRAYVMSSGGLKLKHLKPRIGSRRCFLIFPIQGSERKGLVSVEVKKKKGKYDFKLLAIDVAIPGAEQRVFLVGDETEYKVGGGLIGQLRDPMLKAMAAQEEFDAQDEREEEEEAKAEETRRIQEAKDEEARRNEEIARLERENLDKKQLNSHKQVDRERAVIEPTAKGIKPKPVKVVMRIHPPIM